MGKVDNFGFFSGTGVNWLLFSSFFLVPQLFPFFICPEVPPLGGDGLVEHP